LAGNDLLCCGGNLPVLLIVLGRFRAPSNTRRARCARTGGIDPRQAHEPSLYIVAMLFLIFDVETIFLLPWAIIFMGDDFSFTTFALIEMFVFIAILIVGYYYAWRKVRSNGRKGIADFNCQLLIFVLALGLKIGNWKSN
jgi:NADH-quinone oxidoreductase subunit A